MADWLYELPSSIERAIQWCDQTASPPANGRDTHALQFRFLHHAPALPYTGLWFYLRPHNPPTFVNTAIAYFEGSGSLRADRQACEQISQGQNPPTWVRISLRIYLSRSANETTGLHEVRYAGTFEYFNSAPAPDRVQFPGELLYAVESDVSVVKPSGDVAEPPTTYFDASEGPIYFQEGSVIP